MTARAMVPVGDVELASGTLARIRFSSCSACTFTVTSNGPHRADFEQRAYAAKFAGQAARTYGHDTAGWADAGRGQHDWRPDRAPSEPLQTVELQDEIAALKAKIAGLIVTPPRPALHVVERASPR